MSLQLTLEAGLTVAADIIPIPIFPPWPLFFSAGVGGGVFAELALDLHDNEPDGKVHVNELGNPRLFDASASIRLPYSARTNPRLIWAAAKSTCASESFSCCASVSRIGIARS